MEEDTSELVRIWREKKLGETRSTEEKPQNFVKQECPVPEMMNLTTIHPDSLPPNAHQHLDQRPMEQRPMDQRPMDQRFNQHSIFGGMSGSDPVWLPPDEIPPPPEKKAPKSSFLDPLNWRRLTLNEDEAIIKFNKRATNPRYTNGRFKCHECFSNFAREEKLAKHVMINHSESAGPHMCRFCKRRFLKPCKLRMHVKKHYVQIECLRCSMQFDGEGLAFQHEEFHRGVTTTCKYCNHQFRHKSTYYQHLRTQHRSSHICTLCGASFVSKPGLNVHKKRLHSGADKSMPKEPDANIYCRRCDIKFASMQAYQEHYRHSALHADGVDVYVNDDVRGANYVRCTVCHEQFYTYQACLKHHRRLHPDAPFMKKSIASPAAATSERVNCDVCGALIKATSLYTHMNAHTRTKVYTCQICGMQFPYPTSLLRHKVTHTGEKKYPCPLCEKRFTQRNSMQLHYRTFHLKEPYPKRNRRKKTQEPEVQQQQHPPHITHVSLMGL